MFNFACAATMSTSLVAMMATASSATALITSLQAYARVAAATEIPVVARTLYAPAIATATTQLKALVVDKGAAETEQSQATPFGELTITQAVLAMVGSAIVSSAISITAYYLILRFRRRHDKVSTVTSSHTKDKSSSDPFPYDVVQPSLGYGFVAGVTESNLSQIPRHPALRDLPPRKPDPWSDFVKKAKDSNVPLPILAHDTSKPSEPVSATIAKRASPEAVPEALQPTKTSSTSATLPSKPTSTRPGLKDYDSSMPASSSRTFNPATSESVRDRPSVRNPFLDPVPNGSRVGPRPSPRPSPAWRPSSHYSNQNQPRRVPPLTREPTLPSLPLQSTYNQNFINKDPPQGYNTGIRGRISRDAQGFWNRISYSRDSTPAVEVARSQPFEYSAARDYEHRGRGRVQDQRDRGRFGRPSSEKSRGRKHERTGSYFDV